MSSRNLTRQHAVDFPKNVARLRPVTIRQQAHARRIAAKEHAAAADAEQGQNVLWVMAIALGVFCVFTALVMIFG